MTKQSNAQIAILGKEMTGKSSITYRFINYDAPKEHDPTIEDKFMKVIELNGETVTINLLDTAGQEDYQNRIESWISFGEGFILVFSIDDKETFIGLEKIRNLIIKEKNIFKKINICEILI